MNTITKFRKDLSRVFDDNLTTVQWKNIVDGVIMFFIFLSTLEVFFSTYTGVVEKYGHILNVIDVVTTIFFTIEVTLRIWTCGELDEKYKGWRGKLRYCFSFYGLIDILATYPFYVNFFIPVPYTTLKVLRIARILRVFRYMKSFRILTEAFVSKKKEMWISLQFLCIVTFILSLILYFVEHEAQPEVFDNGATSVVWAFAQYIGDPGGFADFAPVTFMGRIIACLVGVLGIAIFAVPAGLIGSAFVEVIEEHENDKQLNDNAEKIKEYMLVKSIKRGGIFFPARELTFGDIEMNLGLTREEIVKSVNQSDNLRMKNLAAAILEGPKNDMMVVNMFHVNNEYGSCIDRGSSVTIVNPLGIGDNGLSYFDWHLAQLGGFNYVANENFSRTAGDPSRRVNFYSVSAAEKENESFQLFVDDILKDKTSNDWIIVVAGEQVVKNAETDFHFEFGGEKGETSFDIPDSLVHDTELLKKLYADFESTLESECSIKTDAHKVQPVIAKNNLSRFIKSQTRANVLLLNVSYDLMIFKKVSCASIISAAKVLSRNLETKKAVCLHDEEYKGRPVESNYWRGLYGLENL